MVNKNASMVRRTNKVTKSALIWIFLLHFVSSLAQAQTGPGGVGNADGSSGQPINVIWLDANRLSGADGDNVSTWPDMSGNDNNLGTSAGDSDNDADPPFTNPPGTPVLRLGADFQYLEFKENDHDRLVRREFSGFPNANATTFIIFKTSNSGEGIVSYAIEEESNEYLIHNAANLSLFIQGQQRNPGTSFSSSSWQLLATRWQTDGTATLHKAGAEVTVNSFDNGRIIKDGGSLVIGGEQDGVDDGYDTSQDFEGEVAEVIIYDAYLNDAQRIIVENYLSAKYGLTVNNDFYVGDGSGFEHDVAGIGYSVDAGHTKASSAGFVLASTSLGNGEYLFAGRNNTTNATVTTNLQAGVAERFARTWYVNKTGNFDADLSFDLSVAYPSGQFPQDKNDYVLLRKNGTTYDSVSVGGANKIIVGNQIIFQVADANLIDGEYTLGTTDAAASPVAGSANKTWYSYQSGDWDEPNVWTLDGSISPLLVNPNNEIPSSIDDVVITSGRTVTMNINDAEINSMKVTGRLDMAATNGHDFATISGSGRIRIAGNGGNSNFPAGDATAFADATNGGTLEIYGSSNIAISQSYTFNDVIITMNAVSNVVTVTNDLTINGDLLVQAGTFRINDNSSTNSLNLTLYGDYTIHAGARQTVGTANARHELNFYGNFTNNGTAYFSQRTVQDINNEADTDAVSGDGIVDANFLADDTDQRVDVNAPTYFYRIVCDKGTDQTYILALETNSEANFVLTGPADYSADRDVDSDADNANALALITGTVKIGTNVIINPLNNTSNYGIGANARLWIAGGTVTKTGGAAVVPYGTLEISEGTLIITSGSGITTRGTGQFKCSGGTVAIPQFRTSIQGSDQIGGYQQSGGTVTIGRFTPNASFPGLGLPTNSDSPSSNYYTFSLTYPDNGFIISGGTLTVRDATSKGLIFVNSDPSNINVTGGTVIVESNNNNLARITSRAPFYDLRVTNATASTNANAKVAVATGSSGVGADARTITNPDLVVLNNLILQTGTTRTTGGNTYGAYLDFCPDGTTCTNLEVGRDLTIGDNTVLDVFTDTEVGSDDNGSAMVTFNSTTDGVFYVGDITSYDNSLTGYNDPGGSADVYGSYRFPLYGLIIDKPEATLQLRANGPVNDASGADVIGGDKNVRGTKSRLIYVRNKFALRSGATLNQIDPNDDGLGYSMRLYADNLELDGNLFVYEQGVNPTNAFVEFGGNNGTITINSTTVSTIGNIVTELVNDEIVLTSGLYVKRFAHRHGGVNLGTHNLKIDVLDLNPENGADDNVRLRTINGGNNTEYVFGVNGSGANQFFYTAGNASDGGLSLKVPRETNIYGTNDTDNVGADPNFSTYHHEYQNRKLLWFPIGVDGKYTPAVAYLHTGGTTDGDEYVTVNPVDAELKTTNLNVATNDGLLDYYWNVDATGYASGEEPTVSWLFQYDNTDAGNIGTAGENQYVPGKVLNGGAYTRSSEGDANAVKDGGNNGEQGSIIGNNPRNIIVFNGFTDVANDNINGTNEKIFNTPPGNPAGVDTDPTNTNWKNAFPGTGFTLENANYTAGVADRFTGAPTIYYSTTVNNGNDTNFNENDLWTDSGLWSTVGHYSSTNTGTYPQTGDIAYLGFGLASSTATTDNAQRSHWFFLNADLDIAELIFAQEVENADGIMVPRGSSYAPQLVIDADNAHDINLGKISGRGTFNVQVDCSPCSTNPASATAVTANIAADFGEFAANEFSRFDYDLYIPNDNAVYLPTSFPEEYPTLQIKGQGGNSRRLIFQEDITVNRNLAIRQGAFLRLSDLPDGDIIVKNNLNMTINGDGDEIEFPDAGPGRTLRIEGDIEMDNNQDKISVLDNNSASDITLHTLQVGGDIIQDNGQIDLYNGVGPNRDQAVLELIGTGNATYTRNNDPVMDLYRLVMNKGTDQTSTFTFEDDFNLPAPSDIGLQSVEILNGTLILDNTGIDITLTDATTGNFHLPNLANPEASSGSGGLEIQQGTVRVEGDDTGIILDGLLRISGGMLDMDDAVNNGNNFIQYSTSGNATLELSAGILTVGSHIRRNTSNNTGVLKYRQTGGTAAIGSQAAPLNDRAVFEVVNPGSEFMLTGGSFTLLRQNGVNPSVASLLLEPDTYDLTGSTINLGGVGTPVGQTISVNSTIPLNNLVVNNTSTNDPVARIRGRTLTVDGSLTLTAGTTFDADGWNLNLNGDFVADGTFTTGGNTTTFGGSVAQQISGGTPPAFYNLTKSTTNTLTLSATDIAVSNDFKLLNGTLNDGGRTVALLGNMVHDGNHVTSPGIGEGIVFTGSSKQELTRSGSGTSTFGKLTINNGLGVTIPDGNGYNFTVNEVLRLEAGVFDIGSSLLSIDANAAIEEVNTFGANNMIQTNSSFTDNGVKRSFNPIGSATTLIFPVGQGKYTPVVFSIASSDAGSLTVRPANEVHPSIVDDVDSPEIIDQNNVLQYYWIIKADDLTSFEATAMMSYDQGDVRVSGGNPPDEYKEGDYIPARIYQSDTFWDKSLPKSNINVSANVITFPFENGGAGVGDVNITGDYTAGIPDAIPNEVPTYETTGTNGSYTASATWNPVGTAPAVTDGVGPVGAIIVVKDGHELTFNQNGVRVYQTEIKTGGTLTVAGTFGHRLGTVTGAGTLRIVSNTTSAVLPAGFYNDFLDCSRGSLEYAGTGSYDILGGITSLRNLTLSGSGDRILPSNNLTVCNNLTIAGPTLNNANDRAITVQNNVLLNVGTFNNEGGILFVSNDISIDGGTFNGGTGNQVIDGDLSLLSGTLNVGSGNTMSVKGDVTYSSGTFNGGSGNATLGLNGSIRQNVSGAFVGSNGFHRLQIDNGAGVSFAGNTDIADELILDNGVVHTNNNTFTLAQNATVGPVGGSSSSYVNGRVHKAIANGGSFTFPTGDGNRYGKVSVQNTSGGTYTWYAQYYSGNVVNEGGADNFNPSTGSGLETISKNEYWRIGDNAPTAGTLLADVELRWDASSDVSTIQGERSELCVVAWNTSTSSWDNHGGEGHGAGVTFNGTVPIAFSERVVTLGSTTASNQLPVELISFTANAREQTVQLVWETASEINNDYFEVRRSVDGINFKKIGEVAGNGNTVEVIRYEFVDQLPVSGISYYQLKQVDFDGAFEHSDKISVEWINAGFVAGFVEVNLYPNPAPQGQAKLKVTGLRPHSTVTFKLLDMFGKPYMQQVLETDMLSQQGFIIQPRTRLATGVYVVSVQQGSEVHQKTLIVR